MKVENIDSEFYVDEQEPKQDPPRYCVRGFPSGRALSAGLTYPAALEYAKQCRLMRDSLAELLINRLQQIEANREAANDEFGSDDSNSPTPGD